ncbi:MAG: hypothetical protein AABY26_02420, partial [Nanoarchaeota archaeon]
YYDEKSKKWMYEDWVFDDEVDKEPSVAIGEAKAAYVAAKEGEKKAVASAPTPTPGAPDAQPAATPDGTSIPVGDKVESPLGTPAVPTPPKMQPRVTVKSDGSKITVDGHEYTKAGSAHMPNGFDYPIYQAKDGEKFVYLTYEKKWVQVDQYPTGEGPDQWKWKFVSKSDGSATENSAEADTSQYLSPNLVKLDESSGDPSVTDAGKKLVAVPSATTTVAGTPGTATVPSVTTPELEKAQKISNEKNSAALKAEKDAKKIEVESEEAKKKLTYAEDKLADCRATGADCNSENMEAFQANEEVIAATAKVNEAKAVAVQKSKEASKAKQELAGVQKTTTPGGPATAAVPTLSSSQQKSAEKYNDGSQQFAALAYKIEQDDTFNGQLVAAGIDAQKVANGDVAEIQKLQQLLGTEPDGKWGKDSELAYTDEGEQKLAEAAKALIPVGSVVTPPPGAPAAQPPAAPPAEEKEKSITDKLHDIQEELSRETLTHNEAAEKMKSLVKEAKEKQEKASTKLEAAKHTNALAFADLETIKSNPTNFAKGISELPKGTTIKYNGKILTKGDQGWKDENGNLVSTTIDNFDKLEDLKLPELQAAEADLKREEKIRKDTEEAEETNSAQATYLIDFEKLQKNPIYAGMKEYGSIFGDFATFMSKLGSYQALSTWHFRKLLKPGKHGLTTNS